MPHPLTISSGHSVLDGDAFFVSNLLNGIDLYSAKSFQQIRHFEHAVKVNVPLQITLARQAQDWIVMGGDDGLARIYDRAMGELLCRLEHSPSGHVQVVDVSAT